NLKEINEALDGAKPGEERAAQASYPADYPDKSLAGRTVTYRFTIRDVKERILPEVTEEFASDLGFESLDGLRQAVNDEILADRRRLTENGLKNQLFDYLVREHDFEPPGSWVAASLERLQHQYELPDDEETRRRLGPLAGRWAKFDCLVTRIAAKENVEVTDEEIAGQARRLAAELKKPEEEVAPLLDNPAYRNRALREKVLALLLDKAEIG
ncbi:hypothetical protein FJY71_02545, partial [candidate division WOR-3 bacterium]|nr:hypothetical protein [candidate division WOR-3 bacterium]